MRASPERKGRKSGTASPPRKVDFVVGDTGGDKGGDMGPGSQRKASVGQQKAASGKPSKLEDCGAAEAQKTLSKLSMGMRKLLF